MSRIVLTSTQRLPVLLMGTVAVWALIFTVASLAGLGGRYRLHPDDPDRVPPLPALDLSQASSPLQSVEAYAEISERPLFNPDRRPAPPPLDEDSTDDASAQPPEEVQPLDISVTSIIMTPEMKLAIITDNKSGESQSVRVGGALEGDQAGWTLTELAARKAVFSGPDGESAVDLRVYDGTGGQAPTPVQTASGRENADGGQAAGDQSPSAQGDRRAPTAQTGSSQSENQAASGQASSGQGQERPTNEPMTPEQRAEMIRRRIEERRRQMREQAERSNN